MKLLKFFFILLFFLSFEINANDLTNHLNEFFKQEYSLDTKNFKILLHAPLEKNKICKKQHFLLSHHFHSVGLFDILYICGRQHQFLKLELQIQGQYIIAKKKIFRGTKISASDLKSITGRLDKLPNGTYFNKQDVINRVNVRDILPFQPITSFMTRAFWIVTSNKEVTIKFKGNNFEIITTGKALDNGGAKEKIRVQIKSGKIITGIINNDGQVIVVL
ncbi:flagellar basal body P-ring formation chaperone FlgA [Buchnera aphidicola]|uniref:Flagella basal body P-ring formation protein FlgA n=1 Tax=Buchnera aphidicola (Aphis gossypii) TaxID=98785 RepID=A0A5J6ZD98_9GAMM|nr:flagellar basal body P-ring formation chaperone FlgA [Buchnera aphidicola]QFQ32161.1 flagellar basal body P-ring formation protein FlgA [Buchnera aphidicola (Aphis gossypii)]UPT14687.1 flagellar basal body P-ring formation protein FlgA [Buchnera aphidicola (Aphis gossypii)]